MTAEGAVMQVVDTISYLGKDLHDGLRTGAVRESQVPPLARTVLGMTNAAIIDTLVTDLIEHSFEQSGIQFSQEIHQAAFELYRFNYKSIYLPRNHTPETRYNRHALRQVLAAFWAVAEVLRGARPGPALGARLVDAPTPTIAKYMDWIREIAPGYAENPPFRLALDYVQGMTDAYCLRAASELEAEAVMPGPGLFDTQ